ncbi:MAG: patatin-like phospholipase family protein [Williamsia sp.]|nr:patatin-like phospholipase family protein [Williamsia sp.]
MNRRPFIFFFAVFIGWSLTAHPQKQGRPKIGLTLSGGAAKGLAHIGILKAIDSAGLKIDYITGTSMGSIIGGLYAAGYSADSIEKMSHTIDWDLMLSNQSSLSSMLMEEKDEYGRYDVELPWEGNRFSLPSGVLESQELWLKLAELFSPVVANKDFTTFNIPFKCVATDIGTGEAVVMSKGDIVSAVRASMAIPSLFTAIDYEGRKLVDGGIVRNFPVKDVKEMGADIVIGSNVAAGLSPGNKVVNAFQVLFQVAFFREAEDRKNEVPLCNIYVPIPLENYTMGSFNQAEEIIQAGLEEGRKLYPALKKLVDSLDAIYGKQAFARSRLPRTDTGSISSVDVNGLEQTTSGFFLNNLNFVTGKAYTPLQLSRMVRRAYGTRYYNRIVYSIASLPDRTKRIIFDVTENPLTFSKLSLHYNEFSGISVIANVTSRDFFIKNSRSLVTLNVGENMRLRAEHLQYIGKLKNFALTLGTQLERFDVNTFYKYRQDGIYRQHYFNLDGRIQYSGNRHYSIGAGTRFELVRASPSISAHMQFEGKNSFSTGFVFFHYNSLNRAVYPKEGVRLDAEGQLVFALHPNLQVTSDGLTHEYFDTATAHYPAYFRTLLTVEDYTSLSRKYVLMIQAQSGINYKYREGMLNEFVIGGLNKLFRNQVLFAGLKEGNLYASEVASFQLGLRYEMFNNTYLIGRGNALITQFINKASFFKHPNLLTGYSLTFAYNFALGPLELSVMYCDQSKKLASYINIGIPF